MSYQDFVEFEKFSDSWTDPQDYPQRRDYCLRVLLNQLSSVMIGLRDELQSAANLAEELSLNHKFEQCEIWGHEIMKEIRKM